MNTQPPFTEDHKTIADGMGISLYQRFSIGEASLFLRISTTEVKKLTKRHNLNFIQINDKDIEFFGYQLLEYLLSTVTHHETLPITPESSSNRIIRAKEVQSITGLSRTTIWRFENNDEFPKRVSLGGNSVGWKLSEVKQWVESRQ